VNDEQRAFCGIPIKGNVYRNVDTQQLTQAQYEELVRPLLADPKVHNFGWTQYTPYFNDGETCYFGVRELWLRTVKDTAGEADDEFADYDDQYGVSYGAHPALGHLDWDSTDTRQRAEVAPGYEQTAVHAQALADAMDNGSLNAVLMALFGDHAEITVHKDRITVDEYSHD
jgi:hypothetical protein